MSPKVVHAVINLPSRVNADDNLISSHNLAVVSATNFLLKI